MNPQRTAKARSGPSYPVQQLLQQGLLIGKVIDYGGGKGADFRWLQSRVDIQFFDPFYMWDGETIIEKKNKYAYKTKFDTVICTYVLNVLLKETRQKVIQHIRSILTPKGKAYVTVRADAFQIHGQTYEDGVLTSRNTFQRSFTVSDLMSAFPDAQIIETTRLSITFQIGKARQKFEKHKTSVCSCETGNLSHMNL